MALMRGALATSRRSTRRLSPVVMNLDISQELVCLRDGGVDDRLGIVEKEVRVDGTRGDKVGASRTYVPEVEDT